MTIKGLCALGSLCWECGRKTWGFNGVIVHLKSFLDNHLKGKNGM